MKLIDCKKEKIITTIILITLILVFSACWIRNSKVFAEKAVDKFHSQLNAGQYSDIYSQADEEFQMAKNESDFTNTLKAVSQKLGKVQHTNQIAYKINSNSGNIWVKISYSTIFEEGNASEHFIWKIKGDKAFLISYQIGS